MIVFLKYGLVNNNNDNDNDSDNNNNNNNINNNNNNNYNSITTNSIQSPKPVDKSKQPGSSLGGHKITRGSTGQGRGSSCLLHRWRRSLGLIASSVWRSCTDVFEGGSWGVGTSAGGSSHRHRLEKLTTSSAGSTMSRSWKEFAFEWLFISGVKTYDNK